MPLTAADIEAANKAAERLENATKSARQTNPNKIERMLNDNAPPGTSFSRGTETKPFSFHRFLAGAIAKNDNRLAPHEIDVCEKYAKALNASGCALQASGVSGGLWFPLDINETYGGKLLENDEAAKAHSYVKAVMDATRPAFDPDEANWLVKQKYVKAQSAYEDSLGGSLVAPPVMGDVIPLIRPQAAFLAAGAQTITLPPNGRFVRPRVTGAPSVLALAEAQETPVSNLTTGQMELTAKKIGGAVIMSEEATAFTSGTMDSIAQSELGRSLGLKIDAYAFYGQGATNIPQGITANVYADQVINIETDYASLQGIGTDGNKLLPQYGDYFPALIEERSFSMDAQTGCWVMRPGPYAYAVGLRADAVTPNDQAGPMVDIWRRFAERGPNEFKGRRVVKSTNISNERSKGATTTGLSDVFYGIFQYAMMASYGAINFQQGHNGSTFLNGQYIIRGTMYGDVGFMYPGAFLWYSNVLGIQNLAGFI